MDDLANPGFVASQQVPVGRQLNQILEPILDFSQQVGTYSMIASFGSEMVFLEKKN